MHERVLLVLLAIIALFLILKFTMKGPSRFLEMTVDFTLTSEDAGKVKTIEKDTAIFSIELEANMTTGYSLRPFATSGIKFMGSNYKSTSDPMMAGGGGIETFYFGLQKEFADMSNVESIAIFNSRGLMNRSVADKSESWTTFLFQVPGVGVQQRGINTTTTTMKPTTTIKDILDKKM